MEFLFCPCCGHELPLPLPPKTGKIMKDFATFEQLRGALEAQFGFPIAIKPVLQLLVNVEELIALGHYFDFDKGVSK